MPRWMCDVTRLDKIRNEHTRESSDVTNIAEKMKNNRLKWFGRVARRYSQKARWKKSGEKSEMGQRSWGIGKDMRECGVDEDMIKVRGRGWREGVWA